MTTTQPARTPAPARFTVERTTDHATGQVAWEVYDNRTRGAAANWVNGVRVFSLYPTQAAAEATARLLNV